MTASERAGRLFALKPLSREAIPAALARAEKYRLLNEPVQAESICLDVLAIDPDSQPALVLLLLALTDQLGQGAPETFQRCKELLARLTGAYERAYYEGIVWERRARARLQRGGPGAADVAGGWLRDAMARYEAAEAIRPAGNDESLLRWNSCARTLQLLPPPAHEERRELSLE